MFNKLKNKCQFYQTKFSFGATSAIITNLGLIVGLRTGEHAKIGIIGTMLAIALADNISDSVGIHVFQESECLETHEIWVSTFTNFMTRILVSFSFIFLILVLPLNMAVVSALIWGLLLLAVLSHVIAKNKGINPYAAILEHISIAVLVIVASNFLGKIILAKLKLLG